jgi:serine/threonine-protein kinase
VALFLLLSPSRNDPAWIRAEGQRSSAPPLRVAVTDPEVPHRQLTDTPTVAVSPDGTTIAYVGGSPGDRVQGKIVYVRRADEVRAHAIDPPEPDAAATSPFFSRDGRSLYFVNTRRFSLGNTSGGLYKVALPGGRPSRVAAAAGIVKGATAVEGGIVFSPAANAGLVFTREDSGPLETLTTPDTERGEISHRWPSALPDGRHVLFTIKKEGIESFDQAEIALLDLRARRIKRLLTHGSYATYLPTGHIVFARNGSLMAVPFSLEDQQVHGEPAVVLDGVMTEPGSGAAQYAVAQEAGTLVFVPGGANVPRRDLVWVDRQGRETPTGAPALRYDNVQLSPDGGRVAGTVWGATDAV